MVLCNGKSPALGLGISGAPRWASYADYVARQLSVSYTITNFVGPDAVNVAITGTVNTNSVTLATVTPVALGDISVGTSSGTTLVYNVPVGSFRARVHATAEDACGNSFVFPKA